MHPAIMFGLLGVSIYTGILGWNYRQARLIPVWLPNFAALQVLRLLLAEPCHRRNDATVVNTGQEHSTAICRQR